jgi:glutathione synthase/RimK-type ligase-like ATP-grasp enzyme
LLRILIPTYAGDIHAIAVAIALERKGHDPVLWYGADFPTRQRGSIKISQHAHSWQVHGIELEEPAGPYDIVWFRRHTPAVLPHGLYPTDRQVAEKSAEAFYQTLWQLAAPEAFWVNPLGSNLRAGSKPLQLIEAKRVGFNIPATLVSNDPSEIRGFLAENKGNTVYKTFRPAHWKTRRGVAYLFAADVGVDDLPEDEMLQVSAGIYQQKISKAYEIRVTCFGDRAFAAKLYSQENELGKADWRRAMSTLRLESMILEEDVCQRCFALMRRLGIVFGCFDLIVTPDNEIYFLEVNPAGQFLWVEAGDPDILLLDAFSEFLIQKRMSFSWSPSSQSIRFAEIRAEATERNKAAADLHVAKTSRLGTDRSRKPSQVKASQKPKRGRNEPASTEGRIDAEDAQ